MQVILVDFQKGFVEKGGSFYKPRACHAWLKAWLLTFNRRVLQILSDYSQVRVWGQQRDEGIYLPGEERSCCPPQCSIPEPHIKATNSPELVWRGGKVVKDTERFKQWLQDYFFMDEPIYVVGLTLETCVFHTCVSLINLGYDVRVIAEGTDLYDPTDPVISKQSVLAQLQGMGVIIV